MVKGIACTSAARTLGDLAADTTADVWEQALESALRKRIATIAEVEPYLDIVRRGTKVMSVVLDRRPAGAPPTESLLETYALQLARLVPELGEPVRQYQLYDENEQFVARIDLCWPEIGLFFELDGQGHAHQPVYDARRETAIVAVTGWLPGRFTWTEITQYRQSTGRRIGALARQAITRRAA